MITSLIIMFKSHSNDHSMWWLVTRKNANQLWKSINTTRQLSSWQNPVFTIMLFLFFLFFFNVLFLHIFMFDYCLFHKYFRVIPIPVIELWPYFTMEISIIFASSLYKRREKKKCLKIKVITFEFVIDMSRFRHTCDLLLGRL